MGDRDGSYRPKSPDPSAFPSAFATDRIATPYYPQQQPFYQQSPYQSSYLPPPEFSAPSYQPQQVFQQGVPYSTSPMRSNGKAKSEDRDDDWNPGSSRPRGSGRQSKKQKVEEIEECEKPAPGVEEGIRITQKFPTARIKRIMQADEDVGKVAQVTPAAVSRALELFMIHMVTNAANEARARSSKRVTTAHLKQVVDRDAQLDFLADIVAKVPDPVSAKREDDDEDSGRTKERKGSGRKKRREPDDE